MDGDSASDLCVGAAIYLGPLPLDLPGEDTWFVVTDNGAAVTTRAGDVDADGWTDLVYGSQHQLQGLLSVFSAPAEGAHLMADADVTWTADSGFVQVSGLDADLDGDGSPDLVSTSGSAQHVHTALVGGVIEDSYATFAGGHLGTTGDFDGDGASDLWTATQDPEWPRTILFLGPLSPGALSEEDAAAIYATTLTPEPWKHVLDQVAADLDGDSLDDLAASFTGQVAVVLGSSL